jgi:hypothetical protein
MLPTLDKKTLVVNLLSGPGAGKSSLAASIYSELKWSSVECELALEFAKELTWQKRFEELKNQIYVFGEQHHRVFYLLGQVDVIVTDSPLFLTPIYAPELKTLTELVLKEIDKLKCLNVFVNRKKKYNPNGRNQTETQAIEIDEKIKSFLKEHNVPYIEADGTRKGSKVIFKKIIKLINQPLIDIDTPVVVKNDKCRKK